MRTYSKIWIGFVAACFGVQVFAALFLPNSFALKALSDILQCLLLFSGSMALVPQVARANGRLRLFWMLIGTGVTFWFSYQLFWTYYEIWLRADVPDLCAADIIMFLHIVPLMAAVALRPHAPQDEYAARLRRLDFALMMVWWGYLYVLIVIPWQYVVPNVAAYGANLNLLYLIEKLAFLGVLFATWKGSKGGWKVFYANLFGATFTYSASSYIANWALSRHLYYSGSLYDIPLAVSMAWWTWIALRTREREPQAGVRSTSTSHGVWLARTGMIAVFSLPLFAVWSLMEGAVPQRIRVFRLTLTLGGALLMGIMMFVRQRLLDAELLRLLTYSRDSLDNLKHLQSQITESEKLASIGQLVGGAAHELNNPITAMLGYSDLLLLSQPLTPEQTDLAGRIGQQARRTKSLVASLLSFAKPSAAALGSVDLNTLLRTAVKLSQPQLQAQHIEVRSELPPEQLQVRGDSNQLLQVCVQVVNDALHAAERRGGRVLRIHARRKDGFAVIHLSVNLASAKEFSDAFGKASITESQLNNSAASSRGTEVSATFSSLGLSACQGILLQHHGKILWHEEESGEISVRIEIPLLTPAAEKSNAVERAATWQPLPFA